MSYQLRLNARDYFQFGKGVGGIEDDNKGNKNGWVNKKTKRETTVAWENGKPTLRSDEKAYYLLPATSIKGALSHRIAFHYNKLMGIDVEGQETKVPTIDYNQIVTELLSEGKHAPTTQEAIQQEIERLKDLQGKIDSLPLTDSQEFKRFKTALDATQTDEARPNVGENNNAVRALFGYAIEGRALAEAEKKRPAQRGRVLIDDIFLDPATDNVKTKTFSHVMIDRFTGGAKAGALFNEEVASTEKVIELKIHVHQDAFLGNEKSPIKEAFLNALQDLADGQLPLGGGVAKGHGIFSGELITPETQQA